MFNAKDMDKFIDVQESEIHGLEKDDVFDYRRLSELPAGVRLLSSIWSYRRKRRPDGTLLKYKSRICADGSRQRYLIDYVNSYAPVVHWSTVRLILTLSAILNFKTRQVNFTQAFPQAPLDDDVYLKVPQGWYYDTKTQKLAQSTDPKSYDGEHCIKLKKNLYGVRQSAYNWFQHCRQGFLDEGFKPSNVDPCLFIRDDCIIVVYTDDCLFICL
jgi:hypothetical protein